MHENEAMQRELKRVKQDKIGLREKIVAMEEVERDYNLLKKHVAELKDDDVVKFIMAKVNSPTMDDRFERRYITKVLREVRTWLGSD